MRMLLEEAYKKIISFLNKEKFEYLVIGGIAAGILAEPRMTLDIDIDIFLDKDNLGVFLDKVKKAGFKVDKQRCIERAKEAGVFQIGYGDFHVDFIIASIDLEKEAFKRKKALKLYNLKAFFPTPEDFILLKIVPGRSQDMLDVERAILRHKENLDIKYLKMWAQRLSDEAEDTRIWSELQRLLAVRK